MDRSVIAASTDDADAGPSAWHRLGYFVRRFPLVCGTGDERSEGVHVTTDDRRLLLVWHSRSGR